MISPTVSPESGPNGFPAAQTDGLGRDTLEGHLLLQDGLEDHVGARACDHSGSSYVRRVHNGEVNHQSHVLFVLSISLVFLPLFAIWTYQAELTKFRVIRQKWK